MTLLAGAPDAAGSAVVQIVLAFLGVVQTISLAIIADRSRRVRRTDRSSRAPRTERRTRTAPDRRSKGPDATLP